MTTTTIINDLCLDGHDSELFSFLHRDYVEQLRKHPSAGVPLWTLGRAVDGKLASVTCWNSVPSCLAWTKEPTLDTSEPGWVIYRGFTTSSDLITVNTLTLVRYLFGQSYTCGLDDYSWIGTRADPSLYRLRYIRSQFGCSKESPGWLPLQAEFFDWCLEALELVGKATGAGV